MSELHIPDLALVALVGVSGSGKSTFAAQAFEPYEVLSSDYCRALVSGDANDQSATNDAFDVLYYIAGKRLDRGLLTVVDATTTSKEARAGLVKLAREHHQNVADLKMLRPLLEHSRSHKLVGINKATYSAVRASQAAANPVFDKPKTLRCWVFQSALSLRPEE